jgi:hypothetical protein
VRTLPSWKPFFEALECLKKKKEPQDSHHREIRRGASGNEMLAALEGKCWAEKTQLAERTRERDVGRARVSNAERGSGGGSGEQGGSAEQNSTHVDSLCTSALSLRDGHNFAGAEYQFRVALEVRGPLKKDTQWGHDLIDGARQANPNHVPSIFHYGMMLEYLGRLQVAEMMCARPSWLHSRYACEGRLSAPLQVSARADVGRAALGLLLPLRVGRSRPLALRGRALERRRFACHLRASHQRARARPPDRDRPRLMLDRHGHMKKASQIFQAALIAEPDHPDVLCAMGSRRAPPPL